VPIWCRFMIPTRGRCDRAKIQVAENNRPRAFSFSLFLRLRSAIVPRWDPLAATCSVNAMPVPDRGLVVCATIGKSHATRGSKGAPPERTSSRTAHADAGGHA
jgi:hypothetical protein